MTQMFIAQDDPVLHGVLAELAGDIAIMANAAGFIEEASQGLERLGLQLDEMLIGPHLADLTDEVHGRSVRAYLLQTLEHRAAVDRLEIPVRDSLGRECWYSLSLSLQPAMNGGRAIILGNLRCVEQQRALEARLVETAMTDPQTGLVNRQAFLGMTSRLMAAGHSGAVALFEIDRLRAIRLRFGQRAGDEVIEAFARFLRSMLHENHILARFEEDRLAAMLPDTGRDDALGFANEIISTFEEILRDSAMEDLALTASASVTMLESTLDKALVQGEVALTIARSAGGHRVESGDAVRQAWRPKLRA